MRRGRGPVPVYLGVLVLLVVGVLVFAVDFAALLHSPAGGTLAPPSPDHLFGTDRLGRDVLARTASALIFSAGNSAAALVVAVILGTAMAVLSVRHLHNPVDRLVVLIADATRSFPSIVLALMFVTAGVPILLLLPLYFWIPIWRVARVSLAAQRRRPYMLAALLFGRGRTGALVHEGLRNILPGLRPYAVLVFAEILSVETALEFLGFGPPLSQPSLGNILSEALRLGDQGVWIWMPSLILIVAIVVSAVFWAQRASPSQRAMLLE